MLRLLRTPLFLLLLPLIPLGAFAQTFRGTLSGIVLDAQGAVIAGASVQLANPATGVVLNDLSSKSGTSTFPSCRWGRMS